MSDEIINDVTVAQDDASHEQPVSRELPGALLAAQRNALGWTVEQVAAQLKLAPRQIVSLETDNFDALPGMSSVRGFIRSYAKILRLDAGPLIAMVPPETPLVSAVLPIKKELSAPFFETRLRTLGKPAKSLKTVTILGAAVLAIAGLVIADYQGLLPTSEYVKMATLEKDRLTSSSSQAKVSSASSMPEVADPIAIPDQRDSAEMKNPVIPASAVVTSSPTAVVASAKDPVAEKLVSAEPMTSPVPDAKGDDLVLQLREDSWLDIKRANGSSVISRVVKAGATETFSVTEPIQLTIGNVHGVDATLRGVPLELKSGKTNTIRLNLK